MKRADSDISIPRLFWCWLLMKLTLRRRWLLTSFQPTHQTVVVWFIDQHGYRSSAYLDAKEFKRRGLAMLDGPEVSHG